MDTAIGSFTPMLEGGQAILFNDLDVSFDPILEVVSSWKYIRKQAGLFEASVNKGKLFVCSMKMSLSDPGSRFLLDSILSYASGNEFQPRTSMPAEQLLQLLVQTRGETQIHPTDKTQKL